MFGEGVNQQTEFECPQCGRYCRAESTLSGQCVIIHALPTCRRYDELDNEDQGADFIRDARLKLQN